MSNLIKKVASTYDIALGTEVESELYGVGRVISANAELGCADVQFNDHIERNCDIRNIANRHDHVVYSFNCPVSGSEVPVEACSCGADGIHACKYFKTTASGRPECHCEEEMQAELTEKWNTQAREDERQEILKKTKEEWKNNCTNCLIATKFEDVLDAPFIKEANSENLDAFVVHSATGTHGKIETAVSDNAVLVKWATGDKTVCQTNELEADNDTKLMYKINQDRLALKKKEEKPVVEDFKKMPKEAKDTTEAMLNIIATMDTAKKFRYAKILKSQLENAGIYINPYDTILTGTGKVISYSAQDADMKQIPEIILKEAAQKLGYSGDIFKVYATLQSEFGANVKSEDIENADFEKTEDLKTLF